MKRNKIIYSVIIPYSGRLRFVTEAISSVVNQAVNPETVQILAIGEPKGDKETTNALKKKFPNVQYIKNEDLEGPGGKRNTGLKYSKGKFVVFLDSDDRLKPNYLDLMARVLTKNKNTGAVVCFSDKYFDGDFPFFEKIIRLFLSLVQDLCLCLIYVFNRKNILPSAFYLCQMSHMIFKREVINKMKFNYDYRRGGEDWDFVFRLSQSKNIVILPRRLLIFRYSLNSSTYTKENIIKKWNSYKLLATKLPPNIKKTIFYNLFLQYINFFKN